MERKRKKKKNNKKEEKKRRRNNENRKFYKKNLMNMPQKKNMACNLCYLRFSSMHKRKIIMSLFCAYYWNNNISINPESASSCEKMIAYNFKNHHTRKRKLVPNLFFKMSKIKGPKLIIFLSTWKTTRTNTKIMKLPVIWCLLRLIARTKGKKNTIIIKSY